jgi:hypothetical protein
LIDGGLIKKTPAFDLFLWISLEKSCWKQIATPSAIKLYREAQLQLCIIVRPISGEKKVSLPLAHTRQSGRAGNKEEKKSFDSIPVVVPIVVFSSAECQTDRHCIVLILLRLYS